MKRVGWGENDAGQLDSEVVEQIEEAYYIYIYVLCIDVYYCWLAEEYLGVAIIRTQIHVRMIAYGTIMMDLWVIQWYIIASKS